ncbi:MAG: OmpA family protein [Deferribacteraceae bacterium]|jgi:OOP family OmpA-OmpF porin|nr:OmpA family protein [Deferribacteraceae bacterium]
MISPDTAEDMKKLKKLLLQDEIDRLNKIEAQINDPLSETERVSGVIAEAVIMSSNKNNKFSKAIEPVLENSLIQNIHKQPQEYINLLFPIIGSTIRKSISETLNSMLGSFSRGLEKSFSLKGLKWRIEAIRSGKSFSEVVMLHTLVYSVDQVFLIHSGTGLLLMHVERKDTVSKDADMVSGMLTAIQDFAKDCFNKDGGDNSLNSLKMDTYTLFIEQGPSVYIACVTNGIPPPEFPSKLRECIELIMAEFREPIARFDGDTAPFAGAGKYLLDLLDVKFAEDGKNISRKVKATPVIVLSLLFMLLLCKSYSSYKMNKGVNLIKAERGIFLVDVKKPWGFKPWHILLYRDDFALSAQEILKNNGYREDLLTVQSIPFISYDPEIVRRRIMSKLDIPKDAAAFFDNGTLTLKGSAAIRWITDARQIALATPGILRVDISEIYDPRFNELEMRISEIEKIYIQFPHDKSYPVGQDAQKLEDVVNLLVKLEKLAKEMNLNVSLTVYGHTDLTGSIKYNYELSQERAKTIAYMLFARGAHIAVSIFGMGSDYAENSHDDPEKRRIELKVTLLPNAEKGY